MCPDWDWPRLNSLCASNRMGNCGCKPHGRVIRRISLSFLMNQLCFKQKKLITYLNIPYWRRQKKFNSSQYVTIQRLFICHMNEILYETSLISQNNMKSCWRIWWRVKAFINNQSSWTETRTKLPGTELINGTISVTCVNCSVTRVV